MTHKSHISSKSNSNEISAFVTCDTEYYTFLTTNETKNDYNKDSGLQLFEFGTHTPNKS